MECPLCGADFQKGSSLCHICGVALTESIELYEEDREIGIKSDEGKLRLTPRVALSVFVGFLFLAFSLFLLKGDLYKIPSSVEISRLQFKTFKQKYLEEQERWSIEKRHILDAMASHRKGEVLGKKTITFDSIPLEVIAAYLFEDLGFNDESFSDVAIYPSGELETPVIILSKKEGRFWPFNTILSLEIVLSMEGSALKSPFKRLRRGERELAPALAWHYFGNELEALRGLEAFKGGIYSLKLSPKEKGEKGPKEMALTWEYYHYRLG